MTREEFYKLTDILNSEVLGNFMHGGEADELIAMFEETVEQSNVLEQEEPVSEEFKEFEKQYLENNEDEIISIYDRHAGLMDGAKWQKEKMIANTADAMIGLPYENKDGGYTHLIDVSRPLPVGNNKIAIIFKED